MEIDPTSSTLCSNFSFYSDKACAYLNENLPAEDCVDDALNDFRSGGDMMQDMLNVR